MSSDRTKQICLWMTIYVYIYMYIYIYIYGNICNPRFHALRIHQTELKVKKGLIWSIFFCVCGVRREGMCALACVRLNISVFVYVMLLAQTYIGISAYIMVCIFRYMHIFPSFAGGGGLRQMKSVWEGQNG